MYIYICIYIYMYIHMYIYIYTYTHTYIYFVGISTRETALWTHWNGGISIIPLVQWVCKEFSQVNNSAWGTHRLSTFERECLLSQRLIQCICWKEQRFAGKNGNLETFLGFDFIPDHPNDIEKIPWYKNNQKFIKSHCRVMASFRHRTFLRYFWVCSPRMVSEEISRP